MRRCDGASEGARVRRCDVVRWYDGSYRVEGSRQSRNSVLVLGLLNRRDGPASARATAMAGAKHFRDLVCWQLANELKLGIYRIAESPPIKSDFKFRDQLIHAAASAPRNIAEGFGRRTHRDFAQFLDIARGSLMECQNHLQDAVDRGYLAESEREMLTSLAQRSCGAVARLQRYLRGTSRP